MAVYTRFEKKDLERLLQNYEIGTLVQYTEIEQGVENSNYILETSQQKFILTIYEKRVDILDLPYFLEFSEFLGQKGINTPSPVRTKSNDAFVDFVGKKAAIINFLDGNNLDIPNVDQCYSVAQLVAQMHVAQRGFVQKRHNNLSPRGSLWHLYEKISNDMESFFLDINQEVTAEVLFLKSNFPKELEEGNIHADIFPDNVFFHDNQATGIIDFYFSCTDFIAYDLAIILCAWCFDKGQLQYDKFRTLLCSYHSVKPLNEAEINNLMILMRGAAMRFFLTRANDYMYHPKDALVKPKDPYEYYKILINIKKLDQDYPKRILA